MPKATAARTIIVDSHSFFRTGMRVCLEQAGYIVLGELECLNEALEQITVTRPELVVAGPSLEEHTSLELCRRVSNRQSGIKLIILSKEADDPLFQADAIYAGATACLRPDLNHTDFCVVLAHVLSGHYLFPREILPRAFQPIKLTSREHEVLKLMAGGQTDREIADQLVLSVNTVRNHSQRILEKLEAPNRQIAVRRARRRGLVSSAMH